MSKNQVGYKVRNIQLDTIESQFYSLFIGKHCIYHIFLYNPRSWSISLLMTVTVTVTVIGLWQLSMKNVYCLSAVILHLKIQHTGDTNSWSVRIVVPIL